MPQVGQVIQFKAGLEENYKLIEVKDPNTVYFCTDSQRIFVGEAEYSRPVQYGASVPEGYMPPNSLFYHTVEKSLYFSQDGSSWQTVSNSTAPVDKLAGKTILCAGDSIMRGNGWLGGFKNCLAENHPNTTIDNIAVSGASLCESDSNPQIFDQLAAKVNTPYDILLLTGGGTT